MQCMHASGMRTYGVRTPPNPEPKSSLHTNAQLPVKRHLKFAQMQKPFFPHNLLTYLVPHMISAYNSQSSSTCNTQFKRHSQPRGRRIRRV